MKRQATMKSIRRHPVRIFVSAILSASVLAGCDMSTQHCEIPVVKAQMAQLERSAGARFADEYFTFFRRSWNSCHARLNRADYIYWFFHGFQHPGASFEAPIPRGLSIDEAGMLAGQRFRAEHPGEVAAVYASFGYSPISVRGVWHKGLESNTFIPAAGYEGETWGFETLPAVKTTNVRKLEAGENQSVEVHGYLSGPNDAILRGHHDRILFVEELAGTGSVQ
jgi:hypothetical protein